MEPKAPQNLNAEQLVTLKRKNLRLAIFLGFLAFGFYVSFVLIYAL